MLHHYPSKFHHCCCSSPSTQPPSSSFSASTTTTSRPKPKHKSKSFTTTSPLISIVRRKLMLSEEMVNDVGMDKSNHVVSESGSESEEPEDVKLTEPSKNAVNNREGLLDKLRDINWPANVEWIHKLSLDIDQAQEVDVNDDLTRELAFYTQALEGAMQALLTFQSMGLPFLRPSDYYAEMVKSDAHMEKVKGGLLAEKKKVEEAEERKKARENKKLAKETHAQKLKEKAKQKKDNIEFVKKWRKQRQQSGFTDGNLDLAFEEEKPFDRMNRKMPWVAP